MPEALPLQSDDPSDLGQYHLVGRLRTGRHGVVYLARGPQDEHVAVTLLHSGLTDPAAFLDKIEHQRRMSAFYTAQVIESGLAEDRPYIVSEYIDGPSLQKAVEDGGPLRGAALHRLAISTMTALVALHQAGIAHREFDPGNVLVGPDGPRVIDAGLAEALSVDFDGTTRSIGGAAHLTPEHLDGAPIGPPTDMFAWGATMLFAASGRAPFDAGSMSATINLVLRGEPDLAVLDDDLLPLVAECLSKDPARRPTAADALLRLVGHSRILATLDPRAAPVPAAQPAPPPVPADLRSAPPPDPASRVALPPPPGARLRPLPMVAAALAIALLSGGTVYAVTGRDSPAPAAGPAPTPVPSFSASVIEATPTHPPPATKEVKVPGTDLVLHENPADPLRVGAFMIYDPESGTPRLETLVRDRGTGTFRVIGKDAQFGDPSLSPDGTWVAINPWMKYTGSTHDYVTFINRKTGERFSVDTLDQPLRGLSGVWSEDSTRLLLTVYEFDLTKKEQYPSGYVIVDVNTRKATVVKTDERDGYGNFLWTIDGRYVANAYSKDGKPRFGLRLRDLRGNVVRTMPWVGLAPGPGAFSPSGASFYTYCPQDTAKVSAYCVWNLATGNRTATVPSVKGDDSAVMGWWDEHHLIVYSDRKDRRTYEVIDFHGEVRRTLAELPKKDTETLVLLKTDTTAP
ncbi:serine/threonine-protein kinase [Sphaerisporangium sp. NPDC051011]|uniref:serine/threonine-protein kinase n=1 Tax=Sphaerisporangium sp. NPDC051011 TaxID=3155792 RepID=UPI0033E8EF8D